MPADDFHIPITGVPELDRDHERLVLLIREVCRQLHAGRRGMAVACGRQAYALLQSHMAREESFLRSIRYPWLEEHLEGKARLREVATWFVVRVQQAHVPVRALQGEAEELSRQVAVCLGHHDQRYAEFLRAKSLVKAAE